MDSFFAGVGDNLRAGRIRMVFVADVIPDELMRITEFLNEQMNPAEVFAVQVKRYRATAYEGGIIVPAVYGRTATASVKSTTRRASPDRATLLEQSGPATREILRQFDALAEEMDLVVRPTPTAALLKTRPGHPLADVYLTGWGSLYVHVQELRDHGFEEEASDLLAELQSMTSKKLTEVLPGLPTADVVAHWPRVRSVLMRMAMLASSARPGGATTP